MTNPVVPQSLFFDAAISGTTGVALDRGPLLRAKLTNTVATGSAKASLTYGLARDDPRRWPWGLRAMDRLAVAGWASDRRDDASRVPLWTGFLDAVTANEDPAGGLVAQLDASTVWKALEVATETPAQYDVRTSWQGLPVSDIVRTAVRNAGLPPPQVDPGIDPVTDLYSVVSTDATAILSPVYQDWATIAASAANLVGMELFADETGTIRYRQSGYDAPPVGAIPTERLLSVGFTLDTDAGIANQVIVRWGAQQSLVATQQAVSGPPSGYDVAHYRNRVLMVGAPWIDDDPGSSGQQQAQWYADWALSWAFHNSRTAVVSVAFWPQVRVGSVYTLDWPAGTRTNFYVASVVHDITAGGPAATVLGLTYGRPLDVTWFAQPAPAGFGQYGNAGNQATQIVAGAKGGALPSGVNWRTTYYTPAGLATRTDGGGTYLTTKYGAKLYPDGWVVPGQTAKTTYGRMRPCAFDPSYAVPELAGKTLSPGDTLRLDDGTVAQCWDTGSAVAGRHLDLFYQTAPAPAPPDYQGATFMVVANLGLSALPAPPPAPPPLIGPPPPGTPSAIKAAGYAALLAPQLGFDGGHHNNVPPAGSALAAFCTANGRRGNVQCVLFVRFCLGQIGGLPASNVVPGHGWADGAASGDALTAQGWVDATGTMPRVGDVLYFDPGQQTPTGPVVDLTNGNGHVAIVTEVAPPSGGQAGSVTVAQSNCYYPIEAFTLVQGASGVQIGGPTAAFPGTFGSTVAGWVRYP